MKKCISLVLSILLMFSLTYTYIVYAEEEESFFTVSSEEVVISDVLEMTIDLSLIEYDNFIFTLESDYSLESIEVSDDESEEETETEVEEDIDDESEEEEENKFEMQITKTDYINIEEIILIYSLPDDIEAGDVITFVATITNIENEEETESIQVEITVVEETSDEDTEEETQESTDSSNSTDSTEETLKETQNNTQETNEVQNSDNLQNMSEASKSASMQTDNSSMQMVQSDVTENIQTALMDDNSQNTTTIQGDTSENLENEITYNGSDNNYLSELYIEDIDFTQEFQKDNSTYFASIESDIDEVEITATAENDDATVCIYGNDDLEEGVNKILVSVTAENGNVRTYRIYVTVE